MIGARNRDVACRTIYFDIVTAASAVVHHSQWSSYPSSAVKNPSSKNAVVGIADWLVECWNRSLFRWSGRASAERKVAMAEWWELKLQSFVVMSALVKRCGSLSDL